MKGEIMEKLKAVAYCRVSTTKEEQDLSLENQKQDIRNHIESNGFNWELTKIYADRSSATSIHGRKGYKEMMSDLRNKKFDIVVIKDVSRLDRNIDNFTSFCTKLEENNIKLYLLLSGAMYSNENRLITNVYAAFSEEVSRNLSKKINHATKSRQKKGRVITNNKMWGYI